MKDTLRPGVSFRCERDKITIYIEKAYFDHQTNRFMVNLRIEPDHSNESYKIEWSNDQLSQKVDAGIWNLVEEDDEIVQQRLMKFKEERFERRTGEKNISWRWFGRPNTETYKKGKKWLN